MTSDVASDLEPEKIISRLCSCQGGQDVPPNCLKRRLLTLPTGVIGVLDSSPRPYAISHLLASRPRTELLATIGVDHKELSRYLALAVP
jgi:hypothetical protein